MTAARIIKKYPNRRLYDTGRSCYITLRDVQNLITARVAIEVHEQRTGADLTHDVLLQIIAALEAQEPHLLSREFLMGLIRAYGSDRRSDVTASLNRAISV
jgi:polyhydroxyalkanoate synthesis repressor PhaR